MHRLITWLLAGMPNVETFSFGHGTASMTRKDEKQFSYPPLPGIVPPGGELVWPESLKHLKLADLKLRTSDFTSNRMEISSTLESLVLKNCGNNVDAIVDHLRSNQPGVHVTTSQSRF